MLARVLRRQCCLLQSPCSSGSSLPPALCASFNCLGVIACGPACRVELCSAPPSGSRRLWPSLISIAAMVGAGVSDPPHVLLQQTAADSLSLGSCGPDLGYMLEMHSVPDVSRLCAQWGMETAPSSDWQFMGITLPMLALAGFIAMIARSLARSRLEPARQVKSSFELRCRSIRSQLR